MRRAALAVAALAATVALDVPSSFAVMELATVRGRVVDEAGHGVPDVRIVFDFTGETRVKISKEVMSDKKGEFVRAGLKAGHYKITLTKEGHKTHITERELGIGEVLGMNDLLLPKLPAAAPAEAAGPTPGAAPPALPEDATAKVKEAYAKAAEAAKAGQTEDAIAAYKALIERAPNVWTMITAGSAPVPVVAIDAPSTPSHITGMNWPSAAAVNNRRRLVVRGTKRE